MTPSTIGKRAANVAAVRADGSAERHQISNALIDVRSIRAWADAQEAGLITQLSTVDSFPESTIADTNRCSVGAASKTKERSDTLAATPTLADALADGAITAGHVDAVTRGSKKLDNEEQRQEFLDRADQLVGVAQAGTIAQFGKRLDLEIKNIQTDDGEERLTRQRRNTRLSTWIDIDGMWNIRGRFDPATGLRLANKLDAATQALFAKETPEHCPAEPVEKNKFLAAHALAHLIDGTPGVAASGRPEFVAVIDADTPAHAGPAVDFNIPVELPARVLAELANTADVIGVVVRNGVVLHAPGRLDLGRSTRLANRAQRRALRALYATCAIPGCATSYDRCKLHHIEWWRNGGRTDIDNLLPVCAVHHAKIHNQGWHVDLGPNRELTLTLPDGQTRTTDPPNRQTAA